MNITQRALILTLLICTLFSVTSYGNGGPVNESYFYQTGNIRFLNEPRIKVTQEDLFIKIVDDYCEVTVKYVFEGDFNGKVLYGFPVDYWIFRDYYENGIEPEISLDSKNEQFDQDYIKDLILNNLNIYLIISNRKILKNISENDLDFIYKIKSYVNLFIAKNKFDNL